MFVVFVPAALLTKYGRNNTRLLQTQTHTHTHTHTHVYVFTNSLLFCDFPDQRTLIKHLLLSQVHVLETTEGAQWNKCNKTVGEKLNFSWKRPTPYILCKARYLVWALTCPIYADSPSQSENRDKDEGSERGRTAQLWRRSCLNSQRPSGLKMNLLDSNWCSITA